tara:strand:+ start:3535 stop:3921 length:387 start_codon:yes stop_codon:yes gene_type:complete
MAYKYAYFIRGKQLALLEKADTAEEYSSPTKAVTVGLKWEFIKRPLITSDAAGTTEQSSTVSESDYLQIDDYLANALVYYLRARQMEDMGELEKKEYFMREFIAMVGRHYSGRSYGKRQVFPGIGAIK